MLVGLFTNALTGLLINRIPALGAVLRSAVLCAIPPVLMATIDPAWAYWYSAFFAQVSDVFPVKTQALAGAVFNTMAQVGSAIGLTATSILSSSITKKSHSSDQNQSVALMEGYRVAFWMMFGFMAFSCLLALGGLRKLGRIGEKRD
ncbi:hypothetical protein PRZ48_009428 [Zasmidium cellare]|uniref:Uncharacterized protein n=1 Tax=Zasmidium cellare TaxID=395010 RepID=A0ABR0ECI5_ZASCE|nr:hypothetical protein PRZ48_009428 [Zasmidium cellare]